MSGFRDKVRVAVWGEKPERKLERSLVRKIDFVILVRLSSLS